jgi:hypothetical protein
MQEAGVEFNPAFLLTVGKRELISQNVNLNYLRDGAFIQQIWIKTTIFYLKKIFIS